jgi:hypothetical protein
MLSAPTLKTSPRLDDDDDNGDTTSLHTADIALVFASAEPDTVLDPAGAAATNRHRPNPHRGK